MNTLRRDAYKLIAEGHRLLAHAIEVSQHNSRPTADKHYEGHVKIAKGYEMLAQAECLEEKRWSFRVPPNEITEGPFQPGVKVRLTQDAEWFVGEQRVDQLSAGAIGYVQETDVFGFEHLVMVAWEGRGGPGEPPIAGPCSIKVLQVAQ